jgi:hypothetical protein
MQSGFTYTLRIQRQGVKKVAAGFVGEADDWKSRFWRRIATRMARRLFAEEFGRTTPWPEYVAMALGCFLILVLFGAFAFSRLEGWNYFDGLW